MYAIRSRNGKRSFRRSGVEFKSDEWTFLEEITDAQRNEPMLFSLEVEDTSDPRLVDMPPLLKEADATTESDATHSPDSLQARQDHLQREVGTLQGLVAEREQERAALQSENEHLHATIAEFAQANQELGQERETMLLEREALLAERDSLRAEIAARQAGQTASSPAPSADGPAGPPADEANGSTPEPSSKESTGKGGKTAQAN